MRTTAIAAVMAAAVLVSGCSLLDSAGGLELLDEVRAKGQEIEDHTFNEAAKAADSYCEEVPEAVRTWTRTNLNVRTKVATVTVDCGTDAPDGD